MAVTATGVRLRDKNFSQHFLKESVGNAASLQGSAEQLAARHERNVANIAAPQHRLAVASGSAAQQKFASPGAGSFAKQLEQTVRRGRARQGIINRGEPAIAQQQLKDRLEMARQGINRRGTAIGLQAQATGLKTGVNEARAAAKQTVSNAMGGALGFIGGGLISKYGAGLFASKDAPVEVSGEVARSEASKYMAPGAGGY